MAAGSPDKPMSVDERRTTLEEMARSRFGELTPGEEKLLRGVVEGREANLSPGAKEPPEPETATPEQRVRARLLRWLLTDREAQALFEKSQVFLSGALIEDALDLENADVRVAILLWKCRITKPIVLRDARTLTVNLHGCHTAGIQATSVRIQGDCILRRGFVADGEVRLRGARIGGNLSCSGGTFRNPEVKRDDGSVAGGMALIVDRAVIDGEVSFRGGFRSKGEVRLLGAKISGDLDCQGRKFSNKDGEALNASRAQVEGALFLRDMEIEGTVDLTSMSVCTLVDKLEAWPKRIQLGNFRYDEIYAGSPLDARHRIDWLTRQPPSQDLDPQPWRHLAAVLRKQGHEADSRKVMLHYWWRRMWLEPQRLADANQQANSLKSCFLLFPRLLYWLVVGYGYARWRALVWIIVFWVVGTVIFGWDDGASMKEAHPYAMRSRTIIDQVQADASVPPEHRWLQTSYPTLNPWIYSLDTLLPIVDFHQETYWTPKDGPVRSLYLPLHIIMGWVVTSLFVVSFTGLVRRGDE